MRLADYTRSTPFRIVGVYTLLFVISAAILFSVIYWSVTREMTRELKAVIEEDMRPLITAYAEGRPDRLVTAVRERAAAARPGETLLLLQSVSGVVLSGNIVGLPPFTGWQELPLQENTNGRQVKHPNGSDTALVLGIQRGRIFLLVGRSLRHIRGTQKILVRSAAWALAVTIFLALAGGAVFSRGALRRIETINAAFREITAGNLSRRVPARGTRDELDQLAININQMLDQVELLLSNLQQVTNDIAHDLRTPLGRLRQGLEATRLKQPDIAEYQATIDHAIDQSDKILETFAALLRIAQIESRVRRSKFNAVDLSDVSNTVIEALDAVIEDAGQSLVTEIARNVHVQGDKDLITQLFVNLVANATHHCSTGTEISVILKKDPEPILIVSDTGLGIAENEREAVLRRFYRLEKSRTTSGSGLGLALVKAIADLHGANLTLSDNGPGLRVTIRFSELAEN
jgi:signal transduction histidine kinase